MPSPFVGNINGVASNGFVVMHYFSALARLVFTPASDTIRSTASWFAEAGVTTTARFAGGHYPRAATRSIRSVTPTAGGGFAAFGRVVKGMDVVRQIHESPAEGQALKPPIRIQRVIRTE